MWCDIFRLENMAKFLTIFKSQSCFQAKLKSFPNSYRCKMTHLEWIFVMVAWAKYDLEIFARRRDGLVSFCEGRCETSVKGGRRDFSSSMRHQILHDRWNKGNEQLLSAFTMRHTCRADTNEQKNTALSLCPRLLMRNQTPLRFCPRVYLRQSVECG